MKRSLAVLLLLIASGCAAYSLVPAERVTVGDVLSVEAGMPWNRVSDQFVSGPVVIWTADGQQLDSIHFFTGVKDGEALLKPSASSRNADTEKVPTFRSSMSANEIMELFEATMVRATSSTLTSSTNLRPADFAGQPGFRFDFAYTTRDQLERKGIAAGVVKGNRLYMIFFQGTRIYHFGKYLDEAEHIIASARFI